MQLVAQLLAHFTPQIMKSRANAKDPLFGELVIPERLRNFLADLSPMGAFLKPKQLMTNYVNRALARGKCQAPYYAPYIAAGVSASPGLPHPPSTAMIWQSGLPISRRPSQGLNLSPFTLGSCTACALFLPLIFALTGPLWRLVRPTEQFIESAAFGHCRIDYRRTGV